MQIENEDSGGYSKWFIMGMGGLILIYTAYRTFDLISKTLPSDLWWLGLFALAAIDVGLPLWIHYIVDGADTKAQIGIGYCMVVVCALGIAASLVGDTLYQFNERNFSSIKADFAFYATIVQMVVIFSTVIAVSLVHLLNPESKIRRWQRRIKRNAKVQALQAQDSAVKTLPVAEKPSITSVKEIPVQALPPEPAANVVRLNQESEAQMPFLSLPRQLDIKRSRTGKISINGKKQ